MDSVNERLTNIEKHLENITINTSAIKENSKLKHIIENLKETITALNTKINILENENEMLKLRMIINDKNECLKYLYKDDEDDYDELMVENPPLYCFKVIEKIKNKQ